MPAAPPVRDMVEIHGANDMSCWVVPSVASEIWHVPLEQILNAVRCGQIPSKSENGFTFIDVAPQPGVPPVSARRDSRPAPVRYKLPKSRRSPGEGPIPMPRPAELVTPIEMRELHGPEEDSDDPGEAPEPLSMGDWRRGRRSAAQRRTPPR